jgi:polyisoprenoid-binding protein YceI
LLLLKHIASDGVTYFATRFLQSFGLFNAILAVLTKQQATSLLIGIKKNGSVDVTIDTTSINTGSGDCLMNTFKARRFFKYSKISYGNIYLE